MTFKAYPQRKEGIIMKIIPLENLDLKDRTCSLFRFGEEEENPLPLVCALAGDDFSEQLPPYAAALPEDCPPFLLCTFGPVDWNRDYSPWAAPALTKKSEPFPGKGGDTLMFLAENLLPVLHQKYPVSENLLLGYSLGGLLAFWAVCESREFSGCACCSGSLWYDGWTDYLQTHPVRPGVRVYLSLGRREEKARNPRMARVGDATRRSLTLLQHTKGVSSQFTLQEGGHFHQIPERLAAGTAWLLKNQSVKGETSEP